MSMACLGHTQYRWIELIQVSDLAGAYGVSFVVMFVAAVAGEDVPLRQIAAGHFWPLAPGRWPSLAAAAGLRLLPHVRRLHVARPDGRADPGLDRRRDTRRRRSRTSEDADTTSGATTSTASICSFPTRRCEASRTSTCWFGRNRCFPGACSRSTRTRRSRRGSTEPRRSSATRLLELAEEGPAAMATVAKQLRRALAPRHQCDPSRRRPRAVLHLGGLRRPRREDPGPIRQDSSGDVRRVHALRRVLPLASALHAVDRQRLARRPTSWPFDVGAIRVAPSICYENVLSHFIRRQVNSLAAEGKEPDLLGQPDQRRLVLGLERVGPAPDVRRVPRGRMSKAVPDRRQHRLLGLDRQRRPHPRARPTATPRASSSPSHASTSAAVGISNTATGLPAHAWPAACCSPGPAKSPIPP